MPPSRFSHVDLVVSSIERSLSFYRELLGPLGWTRVSEIEGERGETVWYLGSEGPDAEQLGLRERKSDVHPLPYDRYAVGVHHICFAAPSREVVDERARWLRRTGVEIDGGPREYDYSPGYYAVFFFDPDGIKLELLNDPTAA